MLIKLFLDTVRKFFMFLDFLDTFFLDAYYFFLMRHPGLYVRVLLGIYGDNGKYNGNYRDLGPI